MSQSRFVLKQVQVRGTGASDLTRYVAKGKLDREREGRTARLLFSGRADDLTATQARKWLSITGGALDRADVLHYVLSFESAREYVLLGDDEDERRREIVTYMRSSLDEALKTIGIAKMRWVAGIHRNTDNPHIHLLLNKNVIQKASGEITRIAKLPAPLVAHHQVQPNGDRTFSYGVIINSFAAQTDARHRERSRFLQFEARLRSVSFSRELLAPETLQKRQPTTDEMMIGDWIIAEVNAVRAPQNSRTRAALEKAQPQEFLRVNSERLKLLALREKVAELDRTCAERGQPLLTAFINSQDLRALLVNPPLPGARLVIGASDPDAEKTFESERELHRTYDLRISNKTHNLSRNQIRQEKELSPVYSRNERTR
jgi:hypothetical protein